MHQPAGENLVVPHKVYDRQTGFPFSRPESTALLLLKNDLRFGGAKHHHPADLWDIQPLIEKINHAKSFQRPFPELGQGSHARVGNQAWAIHSHGFGKQGCSGNLAMPQPVAGEQGMTP